MTLSASNVFKGASCLEIFREIERPFWTSTRLWILTSELGLLRETKFKMAVNQRQFGSHDSHGLFLLLAVTGTTDSTVYLRKIFVKLELAVWIVHLRIYPSRRCSSHSKSLKRLLHIYRTTMNSQIFTLCVLLDLIFSFQSRLLGQYSTSHISRVTRSYVHIRNCYGLRLLWRMKIKTFANSLCFCKTYQNASKCLK